MPNTVIIGAQWGDEGKAKAIDYLTERSDIIIRFQGGANAGHTVIIDGLKFIFHLVPSGIMYPKKICIVGNGVVFDVEQFFKEVDELAAQHISVNGRLYVSDLAHLVLPFHKAIDQAAESAAGLKKIGTTGRGIGPAYADKVSRIGIRVGDMRTWDDFVGKVKAEYERKNEIAKALYSVNLGIDMGQELAKYKKFRDRLLPMITDTAQYIFKAGQKKKRLLFEGAQGTFLDIDHGTYPFVTSSNTIAGAVCTGVGVGPSTIDHVVGIVKAYTTRVGNGPFPTELSDETGELLRKVGGEYGATTGRPRRCGWFDSVMLRKAIQLNGMTRMAITKLDVLNEFDHISLCTHYLIDGEKTVDYPSDLSLLSRAVPVYQTMKGWKKNICAAKKLSDLPTAARRYIDRLQELCYEVPILMVSVGPDRKQTIEVKTI
jgi:adenylosuccinate synthase